MKTEQTSNVSVEEAAINHAGSFYEWDGNFICAMSESALYQNRKSNFISGANWQKEQDKAIIEELLALLKLAKMYSCPESDFVGRIDYANFENDFHLAISKAEQYINQ